VVSESFTQNGFEFPAQDGTQWLDLTGGSSNSATGVKQTANTTPGDRYTLTFLVGNVVDPGGVFGTTSTVRTLVNGRLILSATNSDGAGLKTQVWKRFAFTFEATSATTTIRFVNGDPVSDFHNGLDSVRLTQQP
jgi:hypothetical protein